MSDPRTAAEAFINAVIAGTAWEETGAEVMDALIAMGWSPPDVSPPCAHKDGWTDNGTMRTCRKCGVTYRIGHSHYYLSGRNECAICGAVSAE